MWQNFRATSAALLIAGIGTASHAQNPNAPLPRATVENGVKANFARMDGNKDGFVTRAESEAAREALVTARMNAMFAALDGDKNGSISRAEFIAANRKAMSNATGSAGAPDREFSAADTNKDGRVSQAEALAGPMRMFTAADVNKDGTLSVQERAAVAKRR
jgi:EF hand